MKSRVLLFLFSTTFLFIFNGTTQSAERQSVRINQGQTNFVYGVMIETARKAGLNEKEFIVKMSKSDFLLADAKKPQGVDVALYSNLDKMIKAMVNREQTQVFREEISRALMAIYGNKPELTVKNTAYLIANEDIWKGQLYGLDMNMVNGPFGPNMIKLPSAYGKGGRENPQTEGGVDVMGLATKANIGKAMENSAAECMQDRLHGAFGPGRGPVPGTKNPGMSEAPGGGDKHYSKNNSPQVPPAYAIDASNLCDSSAGKGIGDLEQGVKNTLYGAGEGSVISYFQHDLTLQNGDQVTHYEIIKNDSDAVGTKKGEKQYEFTETTTKYVVENDELVKTGSSESTTVATESEQKEKLTGQVKNEADKGKVVESNIEGKQGGANNMNPESDSRCGKSAGDCLELHKKTMGECTSQYIQNSYTVNFPGGGGVTYSAKIMDLKAIKDNCGCLSLAGIALASAGSAPIDLEGQDALYAACGDSAAKALEMVKMGIFVKDPSPMMKEKTMGNDPAMQGGDSGGND